MPRRILAALVAIVAIAACIDVPDSMRAQFAPPGPNERTNYKPGNHGLAQPRVDDQRMVEPVDASVTPVDLDAGAPNDAEGGAV